MYLNMLLTITVMEGIMKVHIIPVILKVVVVVIHFPIPTLASGSVSIYKSI